MSPLLYSSDAAVIDFFKKVTGDEGVVVGEGTLIDAYDDGGIGVSLDNADSVEYRRQAFAEGLADLGMKNMPVVASKVVDFLCFRILLWVGDVSLTIHTKLYPDSTVGSESRLTIR